MDSGIFIICRKAVQNQKLIKKPIKFSFRILPDSILYINFGSWSTLLRHKEVKSLDFCTT